jgi:phenylacetate-CoA ligase
MLAVLFQLEQTQWLSEKEIRHQQFRQLATVLGHAYETIPFYRKRLEQAGFHPQQGVNAEIFANLELLKRSDIQLSHDALISRKIPKDHGELFEYHTSGSTGMPIKAIGTDITQFFWCIYTMRDHLWHKRDLSGKLAAIRTTVKDGISEGWGVSTDEIYKTGQSVMMNIKTDIDEQMRWLDGQQPNYLISHPSNIYALAKRSIDQGITLQGLYQVRTFGEVVSPELRSICLQAWNAPVVDAYSCEEIGYIALQCPEGEDYHVLSESLFLEVLDDEGRQCDAGEVGRVVITTLQNFAMPLLRYEIGDYAEVGAPCACGRGLVVLKRIMGRQRNLITLPDGKQHWPSFPEDSWGNIAPIRQLQLVQKSYDDIVVRLVADRTLTKDEEGQFVKVMQEKLGHPFNITLKYLDKIERSANNKYEDFISEVSPR